MTTTSSRKSRDLCGFILVAGLLSTATAWAAPLGDPDDTIKSVRRIRGTTKKAPAQQPQDPPEAAPESGPVAGPGSLAPQDPPGKRKNGTGILERMTEWSQSLLAWWRQAPPVPEPDPEDLLIPDLPKWETAISIETRVEARFLPAMAMPETGTIAGEADGQPWPDRQRPDRPPRVP